MKVRPAHQNISDVGRLEGGNVLLLLGDKKAAQRRHFGLNGGAIDGRRIARFDELLGLARQRDNVASDNADADVVKIVVREDRLVGYPSTHDIYCSGPEC